MPTGRTPCAAQRDCPDDQLCVSRECVITAGAGCGTDDECAPSDFCSTVTRACEAREALGCDASDGGCGDASAVDAVPADAGLVADAASRDASSADATTSDATPADATVRDALPADADDSCVDDDDCQVPYTICEAEICAPGCALIGCGMGNVCNNNTGRCEMVQGPCDGDPDCTPPATVCEGRQCVPGCAEPAGLQCTGATSCNPSTGRCSSPMCVTDGQCQPPMLVCESMACVPLAPALT